MILKGSGLKKRGKKAEMKKERRGKYILVIIRSPDFYNFIYSNLEHVKLDPGRAV
jgi:hypothetical protein